MTESKTAESKTAESKTAESKTAESTTASIPLAQRALRGLGRLAYRRPGWLLILVTITLAPTGWLASQLTLRSSFLDLLPEDREPVRQTNRVIELTGAGSDVLIAIDARDRERAITSARAIETVLADHPHVQSVQGRVDVEFLRRHRLLYVSEPRLRSLVTDVTEAIDREALRRSGLYIDLEDEDERASAAALLAEAGEAIPTPEWTVTADGRWLCLWAFFDRPSADIDSARASQAIVQRSIDELRAGGAVARGLEIQLVGSIPVRVEEDARMNSDIRVAGVLAFVSVVLLLSIALRAPRALPLLSVPLLVGLVWTLALARLAVGHLNIITGFVFSVLSGLGIEYGIHLYHRYVDLRRGGLGAQEATERMLERTGRALLGIGVTNASVFAITGIAEFAGFRELGMIAGAGTILTLLSTLLTFPALNALAERIRPMKVVPEREARPLAVPAMARWLVLFAMFLFTAYSLEGILRGSIRFVADWRALAGGGETARRGDTIVEGLGGTYRNATILVPRDAELSAVRAAIARVAERRRRAGRRWDVAAGRALDDVVPEAHLQARRRARIDALERQLARVDPAWLAPDEQSRLQSAREAVAGAVPFTREDAPRSLTRSFVVPNDGSLVLLMAAEPLIETERLIDWAAQMRELSTELEARGIDAPILSENWVTGEIFATIAGDLPIVLAATVVLVFIVLWIDLRKLKSTLIVLAPVLVGLVCIAGALRLTDSDLNFMNAGILPVCVGISLDNAIHIYRRYLEEGPGSIPLVLRKTSTANLLASATNLIGFATLLIAQHAGLRSIGLMVIFGVSTTYLATSIAFPMALWALGRARPPSAPGDSSPWTG